MAPRTRALLKTTACSANALITASSQGTPTGSRPRLGRRAYPAKASPKGASPKPSALGYRVAEIPVRHQARRFGKSKYGVVRYMRGERR